MNIVTFPDRCIAAGQCVVSTHGVFDQDEDEGTVVVLAPNPPEDQLENVRTAARLCPSGAIEIEE